MNFVVEMVDIESLIPDPDNARKHDDKNLSAIRSSIKQFDVVESLVVRRKDNVVIGGNGRLTVLKELGFKKVPVKYVDFDDTKSRALSIALNRTAELAEWDDEVLSKTLDALLNEGFEVEDIGFDIDDIPGTGLGGNTDDDAVPEVEENEFGVKRGDIWQLGEHRLMCGDSTDKAQVEKLMNGEKADMVFTDPPYGGNVGGLKPYVGEERQARIKTGRSLVYQDKTIINDEKIDWLASVFPIMPVKDKSTKLVFFKWDAYSDILNFSRCWGKPSALLVWDRVRRANNFFRFQPQHELIFHWGNQADKREKSSLSNVFSIEKDESEIHPTVKPIALLEPIVRVCTSAKELVLDPFLGSGSTLIACEKTNRKCYGSEIDPHYCSVIIKRWQDYTGQIAKLVKADE